MIETTGESFVDISSQIPTSREQWENEAKVYWLPWFFPNLISQRPSPESQETRDVSVKGGGIWRLQQTQAISPNSPSSKEGELKAE